MANINIVSSTLSDKNINNQRFVGSGLDVQMSKLIATIDTSVVNIVNGEYYLPFPEQAFAQKCLMDIEIQNDALGANTALSIGLANFDKDNTSKTNGKYSIDSTNITDAKFVASFVTTSAQDTIVSKMKLSGGDYRFKDNDFIVIKNSGTASITSGKIRIIIYLYNM
jgi:hypothetical protein